MLRQEGAPKTGLLPPRTAALLVLLTGNALTEIGISFLLPILPLFLKHRGATPLLVGGIFAAGSAARAASQYPGGWLADRLGRKPVLVGSMLGYSVIFLGYLLPVPVAALVGVRIAHAFVGGLYMPAAAAMLADITPPNRRGEAYAMLRATDMTGLLAGPILGGLVANIRLDGIFVGGGAICLAGAASLALLPKVKAQVSAEVPAPILSARVLRPLLPVALLGGAMFYVFGNYDATWSLYISSRGATPFAVGLSFAVYALPVLLFGGFGGRAVDRLGARRAGTLAVVTFGLLAAVYPLIASVPALILIGFGEGALTAAGQPALQAQVSRIAPPGQQGRVQGIYQTALIGAQVLGSLLGGGLYSIRPAYGFWGSTAVSLIMVAVAMAVWTERGSRRAIARGRP